MYIILLTSLLGIILAFFLGLSIHLVLLRKKINTSEQRVISLYREKIDKIPALVEIIRKHTSYNDIFVELIHLHKIAMVSNVTSIYDLLESNSRIHREFHFLMKVATKIHNLHKNGNFLYIRDFIIFYESALSREINSINLEIQHYNSLRRMNKFTLLGWVWSNHEKIPLSL